MSQKRKVTFNNWTTHTSLGCMKGHGTNGYPLYPLAKMQNVISVTTSSVLSFLFLESSKSHTITLGKCFKLGMQLCSNFIYVLTHLFDSERLFYSALWTMVQHCSLQQSFLIEMLKKLSQKCDTYITFGATAKFEFIGKPKYILSWYQSSKSPRITIGILN